MGIFSTIMEKLGFGQAHAAETPAKETPANAPIQQAAPQSIAVIDVVAKLEGIAKTHPEKLNWKVSIVDLMKLLGIDSSLANRKELATELGYTGELDGSAEMNIWLHKAVMRELAANGGKVPADLTD